MSRNVVICSDGTGNSFAKHVSNVASSVKLLALDDHRRQVAVYDQGIGTDARRWKEIEDFRTKRVPDKQALDVQRGPHETPFRPAEWLRLLQGLAFGKGLKENVAQMYLKLSALYERDDDRVFILGFSRGAFTARALAGLVYRCGLQRLDLAHNSDRLFAQAWDIFEPLRPDWSAARRFRAAERQRPCTIHFLGLWDTVKSYGGLRPIMLPHLRHNPIVKIVRHALALDEQRGWFGATTWGRLDIDRRPHAAMSRLTEDERVHIMEQDVEEVWFPGCHSDVGGGSMNTATARIALRWMLGEAVAAGLLLNDDGRTLLASRERETPVIEDSHSLFWRLIERIPRQEIDNSGEWPTRKPAVTRNAPRRPCALLRGGVVSIHESASHGGPGVKTVRTARAEW